MRTGALFDLIQSAQGPVGSAFAGMLQRTSTQDGGPLSFLLTTTDGSVLVSGSTGYWRGIFEGLRPDVAMLSLTGRPNVNGEPYQGSAAQFMVEQVEALRPGRVAFCHHDPLLPGFPGFDIGAAAAALTERSPGGYFELEYATPWRLFRWPVSPVWGCHVWCSSRVCSTG